MKHTILKLLVLALIFVGCKNEKSTEATSDEASANETTEVNVYTHRHYPANQDLFAQFEKHTDIKANVVNTSADELM
jgi:iron(III) transport system substrate-binding protein